MSSEPFAQNNGNYMKTSQDKRLRKTEKKKHRPGVLTGVASVTLVLTTAAFIFFLQSCANVQRNGSPALGEQSETVIEPDDPKEAYLLALKALDDKTDGSLGDDAGSALAKALTTFRDPIVLEGHGFGVSAAVFNPDGSRILTAGHDGTAKLWDGDGILLATLEGHKEGVYSAVFNHDSNRILTAGCDKIEEPISCTVATARLWDGDGAFLTILEGHTDWISSAIFNPDGSRILTTSRDGTARLWNDDGVFLIALEGHSDTVKSAVFNHDSSRILTASQDGTAKLWDGDGTFLTTLERHRGGVTTAIFNPDGSRILTAGQDGTAKLWDGDGAFLATLDGQSAWVKSAVFNHDGSRILIAGCGEYNSLSSDCIEGLAQLWDGDGAFITALEHTERVDSAVFNHDGSRILTATWEMAQLWDGEGTFIHTLGGHSLWVFSAVFNHDGSRILTADYRTVRLWETYPSVEAMRAEALHRLRFLITEEECLEHFDTVDCQGWLGE